MDARLEQNLAGRCAVGDIATRAAARFKERLAVKDGDAELSFHEVNRLACHLAQALLNRGLGGHAVGIMGRNSWQFIVSYFGCAKAGSVAMLINLGLDPENIAYCLRDAEVQWLIADRGLQPLVEAAVGFLGDSVQIIWFGQESGGKQEFEALLQEGGDAEPAVYIDDRAAAQLLYTSGTTSRPKGVLTSHVAVTVTALASSLQTQLSANDRVLHILPLYHCADLNAFAVPGFVQGAAAYVMPSFNASAVLGLIDREQITVAFLLPMMWQALLGVPDSRERSRPSIRLAMYAMASMPEGRIAELKQVFPNALVLLGAGQTEFTPPTTFQKPEHEGIKSGSWGSAVATVEVGIMDEQGRLLDAGQTGEIVYRGPHAMSGYLNQAEATADAFRHGWFHSGDIGWMDEEGVVWFSDRKKDMVKSGGENVSSLEVEHCLAQHPAVSAVSVIGLPHPYWGEAVTALVIREPGANLGEEALLAYARERLAGFKVPKRIVFVEEFPKTGTGKIQKNVLRQWHHELYEAPDAAGSRKEEGK